ncbi:peptide methionine sulfoxide reductase-like [Chenopodium quinoa]|uniref:peptide methionine sulfoxide reductase-like n=1 Tax=Chenopodium quinoa TaxID=63459 RepID=UPI000B78EF96|nr:peptide methionine sulfoxide reductase-like [Chenopodium quinoa]
MYELLPQISDYPEFQNASLQSQQVPPQFLKTAIFAGGSFRVLESAFGSINGVNKTSTGYFGGSLRKPSYEEVSEGGTGHTEAVKVEYDSSIISFSSLCGLFWDIHDPTNKDYLNFGLSTHERSVIFYSTEEERKEAQKSKIRKQMRLNKKIVTKILSRENCEFFLAENQYQKYYLQKYYKLCGSLGLRSTVQFVESNIACKLNGILGMINEEQKLDELAIFLEIQELSNHAKLACEEIIEDLRELKEK